LALATCGTNRLVGRDFTSAGGNTNVDGIAVWDGLSWKSVNQGLSAVSKANYFLSGFSDLTVLTLSPLGNSVYAGGRFRAARTAGTNEITTYSVARATWDEDQQAWTWSDLDAGVYINWTDPRDGWVLSSTILEGASPAAHDLVVGGNFLNAGEAMLSAPSDEWTTPYEFLARCRVG